MFGDEATMSKTTIDVETTNKRVVLVVRTDKERTEYLRIKPEEARLVAQYLVEAANKMERSNG